MPLLQFKALAISQFGSVDTLQSISCSLPSPQGQEVLIKMQYASINPIDCKTRAGLGWAAQQNQDKLPWIPGYDISGTVQAIGAQVQSLKVGDLVAGMVGFPLVGGCYSQYQLAKPSELVILSSNRHSQQAAALPLAGLTAEQALFDHGQLTSSETIIISAAAGGVGHIAVQLAKIAGAQVIALASPDNHPFLASLGADKTVDYHDEDAVTAIPKADLLLDLVGGESGLALLNQLKTSGRVVTLPSLSKEQICTAAHNQNLKATGMLVAPNREQLQKLYGYIEQKKLQIEIANIYPLLRAQQAHTESETGHVRGKLLLKSESK